MRIKVQGKKVTVVNWWLQLTVKKKKVICISLCFPFYYNHRGLKDEKKKATGCDRSASVDYRSASVKYRSASVE